MKNPIPALALCFHLASITALPAQWTLRDTPTTENLTSVVWNGSQLIATGNNSILLVSEDHGLTWQNRDTLGAGVSNSLIWVEDRVITSNAAGNLYHSTDLLKWIPETVGSSQRNDYAWSGRRLVSVGTLGATVGLGPASGKTLFNIPAGLPAMSSMQSVASNGEVFVAVGNGGVIATSENGENWTAQASPTTRNLRKVRWSGSRFLTVGAEGAYYHGLNGTIWQGGTVGSGTVGLNGIAQSPGVGGIIVIVGNNGTIFTSPGVFTAFTQTSSANIPTNNTLNDVVWTGTQFVAVGNNGTVVTLGTPGGRPLITRHPDPPVATSVPNTPLTLTAAARGATSVVWQSASQPEPESAFINLTASSPGHNTPSVTVTHEFVRYYRFSATNAHGTSYSRVVRVGVETPPFGNNWVRRNSGNLATTTFGNITSDGRYNYATSFDGRIFHSIDGRNWVESLAATNGSITGIAFGPSSGAASTLAGNFVPYPVATALHSTDPRFWNAVAGSGNIGRYFISWGVGGFLSNIRPNIPNEQLTYSNADGSAWFPGFPVPTTFGSPTINGAAWEGDEFRVFHNMRVHFRLRPGFPITAEPLHDHAQPESNPTIHAKTRWRDREYFIGVNGRIHSTEDGLQLPLLTPINNTYVLSSIAANRERIVVAGHRTEAAGGGPVLFTSTDGVNFTDSPPPAATGQFSSVHWNGTQFILNDSTGGFWTLGRAGTGPRILSLPHRVTAWPGEPVTLQVIARGENLSYEWFKGSDYIMAGNSVGVGPILNAGVVTTETDYWVRIIGQRGFVDSHLVRVSPGVAGRDFDNTTQHGTADTTALVYDGFNSYSGASDGSIRTASNPFSNWTSSHSEPGVRVNAMASPGIASRIAVGSGGTILERSGIPWNLRATPVSSDLNAAIWTGSHYFVAGDNGVILRSTDGIAWSQVTPSGSGFTAPTANINGIAFDGSFLMFVGDGGLIFRAIAPNLNLASIRPSGTTQNLNAIVWERGKFIAVGNQGTVLEAAASGTTWTANPLLTELPYANTLDLTTIAANWTDGGYLALANHGILLHSPDGVTWGRHRAPVGGQLSALAWNGGRWIAAASSGIYHTSGRGTRTSLVMSILQHPQDATIPAGTSTQLSYTARGPGIWASWWFRDNPLAAFGGVANSNTPIYATPNLNADRQYRVRIDNPWSSATDSNIAQITIEVSSSGFAQWLAERNHTNPDPNDDPDNYGIPNLVRYALNLPDDRAAALAALGSSEIVEDGGTFLELIYTKLAGLSDATIEVRFSRDLTDWRPLSELGGDDIPAGNDGPETEVRRARVPVAGEDKLFLRITATPQP